MAAVAAVRSITSATVHSLTAAIASPTSGRYDGSLRTPSVRHRREERAVGFDEQPIERTTHRGVAHVLPRS